MALTTLINSKGLDLFNIINPEIVTRDVRAYGVIHSPISWTDSQIVFTFDFYRWDKTLAKSSSEEESLISVYSPSQGEVRAGT